MKEQTKEFMMNKLEIKERFIHPEMLLENDLDLGHFDVKNLADKIEEEFDCWVKLGERNDWKTVGDIAKYIDNLFGEAEEESDEDK
jgi:acyl carrier protein